MVSFKPSYIELILFFLNKKPIIINNFFAHPASLEITGVAQSIDSATTLGKDSECDVKVSKSIPL